MPSALMISGFGPPMLAGWAWAHHRGIPVVVQMDGWQGSDSRLTGWTRRFLLPHAAAGIAAGQHSADWLRKNGLRRCFIAPMVPVVPATRNRRRFEDRDIDLLWVGALQRRKGADRFTEIARAFPNASVVVAGDGPLKSHLRAQLPRATFLGDLAPEQAATLPERAKLTLIPSRYDAGPVSAAEAQRAGSVVLISDRCGAAGDWVRDGVSGLVLTGHDIGLWQQRAAHLLSSPDEWDTLSAQALTAGKAITEEAAVSAHLAAFREAAPCAFG
jgi:glycosyltransferase involved in cell wall biosynthesis